jgi:hypothetical protein
MVAAILALSSGTVFAASFGVSQTDLDLGAASLPPAHALHGKVLGDSTQAARVGQLVYNPGSKTVYLVGSSGLYGFPSAAIFYSWGYNFSQVSVVNSAEASLALVGVVQAKQSGCSSPLDACGNIAATSRSSSSPRVGQLVYNPGNKTVFLVGSDGLHPFSSAAIFYSWNFTFNQIVPANSSESALPVAGLVPTMASGCSSPLNQIAGTCGSNPPVSAAPVISSLSPPSGPVETLVTITGSGFTSSNTIKFDVYSFINVASANGTTLTFNVPSTLYYNNCPAGNHVPYYFQNNCQWQLQRKRQQLKWRQQHPNLYRYGQRLRFAAVKRQ